MLFEPLFHLETSIINDRITFINVIDFKFDSIKMVENNLKTVIIMEDDARFDAYFKSTINYFVEESEKKHIQWDLL